MFVKEIGQNYFVHKKDYFQKENFYTKQKMETYYLNEKIKGANPQSVFCHHTQNIKTKFH